MESWMSIANISASQRVQPIRTIGTESRPPDQRNSAPKIELGEQSIEPTPPRFPWLSRFSTRLEAVSRERSVFAYAGDLGAQLDKTA
jgi:hypothetical protein